MILHLMTNTKFYQKRKLFHLNQGSCKKKYLLRKRTIITCLLLNLETAEN